MRSTPTVMFLSPIIFLKSNDSNISNVNVESDRPNVCVRRYSFDHFDQPPAPEHVTLFLFTVVCVLFKGFQSFYYTASARRRPKLVTRQIKINNICAVAANRPTAMDPQSPSSVLRCCNSHTCALVVLFINIIFSSLGILFSIIMAKYVTFWTTIVLSVIINATFLLLNIQLRSVVLKRNMAPVLLWLRVYITLFIVNGLALISILSVLVFIEMYEIGYEKKYFIQSLFMNISLIEVILAFWIYSVNLYYNSEETRLQTMFTLRHQTSV